MEENGLAAWGRYLKWVLWDRWHGESVSAFDTKRASQDEAPGLNLGFIRISWTRLAVALAFVAGALAMVFLLTRIDWQRLPPGILEALVRLLFVLVPAALIFVLGFVSGYLFKSAISGGGKKDA